MRRLTTIRTAAIASLLLTGTAHAHLNATGLGPVYDGVLHFLTSPEDLVPVIAISLLAGTFGARFGRRTVFTLTGAWFLGSLAGIGVTQVLAVPPGWSAFTFVLLGGLVLGNVKPPLPVVLALAALLGLAHGLTNGSGVGWSVPGLVALMGIAATVFVLSTLVTAFVASLKAHWARIAVRVAGSWIAATGILFAGWIWQTGAV